MGEWFALPLIEEARRFGDDPGADAEIFHPVAERLLARCDACLRIGGSVRGGRPDGRYGPALGKTVYHDIGEIP